MKIIKRLCIYCLIGVILTVPLLYYANNILFSNGTLTVKANKRTETEKVNDAKVKVPQSAECIYATYDLANITYIDSGELYIEDVKKGEVVKKISELDPIEYALPMLDRNLIVYFVYDDNKVTIKTYNIDKDDITEHKSFKVSGLEKIVDVKYSSLTNLIYINMEIQDKDSARLGNTRSAIYRVDILNNISLYKTSKKITNMQLVNGQDILAYEDGDNNIYVKRKKVLGPDRQKYDLLGVDKDNNVHVVSLENPSEEYIVTNGKVKRNLTIEAGYKNVITDSEHIYLAYEDYILDLLNNEKIEVKENLRIIKITEFNIVYLNDKNEVIIDDIKKLT